MKIGLVARCLNTPHIRGMGRYVYELIDQSTGEASLEWLALGDDPRHPMQTPSSMRGEVDIFPFRGDRFQLWEQLGLPMRLNRHEVDVLHCTEGTLPRWQPVPTVVTLHDTIAWGEHDNSPFSRFYYETVLTSALSRCAAIITISESSRRDIVGKWPHLADKTTVIPHGISNEYLKPELKLPVSAIQNRLISFPYLVYLGGPLARKRFDWAVKVLGECGIPGMQLVACGFSGDSPAKALENVPQSVRDSVHFAPFLSDQELLSLYRGATAVLYPTLYEGFGFPAVEAQAAGAPVIFSAVSSLAELVGPMSMIRPPDDLSGWVEAVRAAHGLGAKRHERAALARSWAQQFSWRQSFQAHLQIYQQICRK
jgi:glycosyltransferase involved in cell wall biosynthesis